MVTVAEIARNIGIPATTAREYVGRFKPFFPTRKVSGKRYPMHPEGAEDIMKDIVNSYAKGLTTDDITNLLKEKYPMNADIIDEEEEIKTNGHASKTTSKSLTDTSALQIISQMNTMQMQLMQKMTEVLDHNTQVMERVLTVIEKNPSQKALKPPSPSESLPEPETPHITQPASENHAMPPETTLQEVLPQSPASGPIVAEPKVPPSPPKKFIMPSKEELGKRNKNRGWLGRMFGK